MPLRQSPSRHLPFTVTNTDEPIWYPPLAAESTRYDHLSGNGLLVDCRYAGADRSDRQGLGPTIRSAGVSSRLYHGPRTAVWDSRRPPTCVGCAARRKITKCSSCPSSRSRAPDRRAERKKPAELPFSRTKRWSITILDEGRPEPQLGHMKYTVPWSRNNFID